MNQIKKRLEIIKLAIFMTDAETIKLQLLKLEPFEEDEALNEIISFLRQKNYAQAQALIDLYNVKEYKQQNTQPKIEQISFIEDDFTQDISSSIMPSDVIAEETKNKDIKPNEIDNLEITAEKELQKTEEIFTSDKTEQQDINQYPPIPDIVEKIQKMTTIYLDKEMYVFPKSVDSWIKYIAEIGYTEKGILNMLAYIQKLKNKKLDDEAAQLVIVFGATDSNLGKLLFARELYKGELFQKNNNKAFELIKELASNNCREALCDLGQFYEYGVGTEQDVKQAEYCYKQAIELDLDRAKNLYNKIRKKNKGFFSFLFKDEENIL
ncbi:MAG: hypothetical protein PHE73_02200 [Sulfurovaceae bacterium]|nr:hypothetical protein [Sulfurovaceae bacterium]